ncbi:glycosyltransferase [Allohahella sp. A8]|uniref:glycosyltransferase n=1 Tax=Allohahella sp. A8 TaxID=3141461 RepID=UPI003A80A7E3
MKYKIANQINEKLRKLKNMTRDRYGLGLHQDVEALFSPEYYLRCYPDIRSAKVSAFEHYITRGWAEGRNPSPFFDTEFYLMHNADVARAGMNPLNHFCRYGWREHRDPSAGFDVEFYLSHHPDVAAAGVNPLLHYMKFGENERRVTNSRGSALDHASAREIQLEDLDTQPTLPPTPLASIIIVNFNGASYLEKLFDSLKIQSYSNFEIIFVDNASNDQSVTLARNFPAAIKIIENAANLGFAEGCNIGFRASVGSVIVLLNNDVRVEGNWLHELIRPLETYSRVGAVTSKVRFEGKFLEITLATKKIQQLNYQRLLETLSYPKVFIQSGHEEAQILCIHPDCPLRLFIPIEKSLTLQFEEAINPDDITIALSGNTKSFRSKLEDDTTLYLELDHFDHQQAFFVINNAGSGQAANGMPFDRGFGERDSLKFSNPQLVPFLCGCSTAFKRFALEDEEIFFSDFFAYFEDSDLSRRLRRRGYEILYNPGSVLYHYHSATSIEKSVRWRTLTYRNRVLYELLDKDIVEAEALYETKRLESAHLANFVLGNACTDDDKEFARNLSTVPVVWAETVNKIRNAVPLYRRPYKKIGVYNSYWNSLGGGEARALLVAQYLTGIGDVELISETNFDLDALAAYFSVELSSVKKRIISEPYESLSLEYDVFVNSTYQSTLVSKAKQSFYLVSFPTPGASAAFINSYTFLANSEFTRQWCLRYWGESSNVQLLYPPYRSDLIDSKVALHKEKLILSVGRFTPHGHSKKQLEMVSAFKDLATNHPASGWRLMLIGSVDSNDPENVAYYDAVRIAAEGFPIDVYRDATFEFVQSAMRNCSVYWHMTGYGEQELQHPELFEHFGMTVIEAIGMGAFPIVLNAAGPREIVQTTGVGDLVGSLEELADKTANYIQNHSGGSVQVQHDVLATFSEAAHNANLRKLLTINS